MIFLPIKYFDIGGQIGPSLEKGWTKMTTVRQVAERKRAAEYTMCIANHAGSDELWAAFLARLEVHQLFAE